MIFGRWTPLGAIAAALLFGFAIPLQSELSILQRADPSYILLMAPYVVTIIAVAGPGRHGSGRPPPTASRT